MSATYSGGTLSLSPTVLLGLSFLSVFVGAFDHVGPEIRIFWRSSIVRTQSLQPALLVVEDWRKCESAVIFALLFFSSLELDDQIFNSLFVV